MDDHRRAVRSGEGEDAIGFFRSSVGDGWIVAAIGRLDMSSHLLNLPTDCTQRAGGRHEMATSNLG
jgi:hypothetical protein